MSPLPIDGVSPPIKPGTEQAPRRSVFNSSQEDATSSVCPLAWYLFVYDPKNVINISEQVHKNKRVYSASPTLLISLNYYNYVLGSTFAELLRFPTYSWFPIEYKVYIIFHKNICWSIFDYSDYLCTNTSVQSINAILLLTYGTIRSSLTKQVLPVERYPNRTHDP